MSRSSRARTSSASDRDGQPMLVPCMMLRKGQVCLPGPDGPVVARDDGGAPFDPFDVVDRLRGAHQRMYLVDLDGVERGDPQLAYLQELSRDITLWVDAGVPTADAAIDILVAGADRAILSTAYLRGPVEIRRAWKLSTDWVFEVEINPGGAMVASTAWPTRDPLALVSSVREVGITDVIVSPREQDPDWALIKTIASGGPTWVDGSFTLAAAPQLPPSGAVGGIFHLDQLLSSPAPAPSPEVAVAASPRDDEE
ncbi:MAG: HisA/HisF-related TIM barrel protein [Thermoplasmata archaeon]|nr:HisA/HisF-related TIM barrel protein [Thermoplasmata archaeon]